MHTQFVWPTLSASHKSCMADCILFEKENDFHMAFVLAAWLADLGVSS